MGIFNLFGKKTSHEDDVLYLTYMIMWRIANADDDYNEDEREYIKEWTSRHPYSKMKKLGKMLGTRKLNVDEMTRIISNCSDHEKSQLLADATNIIAADGVFDDNEVRGLKTLCNSIGVDIDGVRELILERNNVDIFNNENKAQKHTQNNDGQVMGFSSHHSDNENNKDLANNNFSGFQTINNGSEVEINWIYGFEKVYDYYKSDLQLQSVPFYWSEEDGRSHSIVVRVVNNDLAIKYIDKLISLNGGSDSFKKENISGWQYLHIGDLFSIGYLPKNNCVRINKDDDFEFFSDEIKYGINENDKKLRNLIKGANKIFYNEGEGPANGRFCVRGSGKRFFAFAYYDNYIDSISYFKKILSNYNKDHHVFKDNEDTLDKIINEGGIIFKNELFELMLIRENVKYKFYITAPGGFFSSKWKW